MARIAVTRRTVKIPQGVQVHVAGDLVKVKGPKGEMERRFPFPGVAMQVSEGRFLVSAELPRREQKAQVGTVESHVTNMVAGVTKAFEYTLKTVYSHFPIKTSVKGSEVLIENFLGERYARRAVILPGVKVAAKAELVTVTGHDLEAVSQTAANIEQATRVIGRDTRVFQDGIYIIRKGG